MASKYDDGTWVSSEIIKCNLPESPFFKTQKQDLYWIVKNDLGLITICTNFYGERESGPFYGDNAAVTIEIETLYKIAEHVKQNSKK